MKKWTGGYAHGASQDSVTERFPTLWTGGYVHGASQVSVTERFPMTWISGYIHNASQDSVTARYSTTHGSVTACPYPSRTSGFTHSVLHVCKLAYT